MRRQWMTAFLTALMIAASVLPAEAVAQNREGEVVIRVGLASASSHVPTGELEAAHLENEDGYGEGYRFGYYDENLDFVELARTGSGTTQVAVLKTTNLTYGYSSALDKYTYGENLSGNIMVGCYHVLVETGLDRERAEEMAARLDGGFVAWIDGEYQVRAGAYTTKEEAQAAFDSLSQALDVVGTSSYGMNVVETGSGRILFQYDMGQGGKLAIQPGQKDGEETRTWFSGYHYRGGFQYHRRNGGNLTVANVVELEDYVNGVICYEMGREWPLEALKTQAMCARTYVLKSLNKHDSYGFDICNSSSCQVYRGMGTGKSYGPSPTSLQAVEETAGLVITYRGELAETPYSSSHGGASEDAKNVWGTDTVQAHPYLRGVVDPYESYADSINAKSSWTVTYTAAELTRQLQSKGYGSGTSVDHLELTYSQLGNVIRLVVHWENGRTSTFTPSGSSAIRGCFGVDSIRFTVNGQTVHQGTRTSAARGSSYAINGQEEIKSAEDLYAISGDGTVSALDRDAYVITGRGSVSSLSAGQTGESGSTGDNQGGGVVTVSGSRYVFEGGGWGHQLGMSQYGAYAMAKQGFDYEDIITHYFPGVEITRYRY